MVHKILKTRRTKRIYTWCIHTLSEPFDNIADPYLPPSTNSPREMSILCVTPCEQTTRKSIELNRPYTESFSHRITVSLALTLFWLIPRIWGVLWRVFSPPLSAIITGENSWAWVKWTGDLYLEGIPINTICQTG